MFAANPPYLSPACPYCKHPPSLSNKLQVGEGDEDLTTALELQETFKYLKYWVCVARARSVSLQRPLCLAHARARARNLNLVANGPTLFPHSYARELDS